MPAPPELPDAAGDEGVVEVFLEIKAENTAQADGHVAVAAEIKVNLQRVAHCAQPGAAGGELSGGEGKDCVRQEAHLICDQHLFGKAEEKAADAPGDPVGTELPLRQLPGDIPVAHDGAGDQLGKESNVQQHREETSLHALLVPIDVDHIAQALEGEEGDADGQPDPGHGQGKAAEAVEDPGKKAGVFIDREQPDVQDRRQSHRSPVSPGACRRPAQHIVQQDGQQHDQHGHRFPKGVKDQTCRRQEEIPGAGAGDQSIEQKDDGEKDEKEG